MAGIYLRIDVDKPFGKKNIITRILSKLREDYYFPIITNIYMNGLEGMINLLNENNIKAHIYFRNCTVPLQKHLDLLDKGNHIIGFHAENTISFESFENEFNTFSKKLKIPIKSFTKHGSGKYKLGKYHYPKYEPEKYISWAKKLNINYLFGNEIITTKQDESSNILEAAFWIEHNYRHPSFCTVEQLIDYALVNDVAVLIHPSNFEKSKNVKKDFKKLIRLVNENNITIKMIK